jgi:hypothetical protein
MTRKLTPITPLVNGYCVIVVQEATKDGNPGAFLGCLLQTPESSGDGPLLLLGEAIKKYKIFTATNTKIIDVISMGCFH